MLVTHDTIFHRPDDIQSSVATVKRGVDEVLDIIALDVDRRSELKRGPKLGSTQSSEAKASRAILRSLGRDGSARAAMELQQV